MTTRARKELLDTANERLQLAAKAWVFIASVILATNYMTSRGQAFVDGSDRRPRIAPTVLRQRRSGRIRRGCR
ncbi:hypothetical protein [Mycolicibacterium tusciae]|uniref:hypothetical protein n=1 Tax=Mycolicibacterium tusciae TaxID=75922 RepID=UPI000317D6AE|nr:hypothetical protein [Mycolicibacterium tusciae]